MSLAAIIGAASAVLVTVHLSTRQRAPAAGSDWKAERKALADWTIVFSPTIEGATDVFFAGRIGGFAGRSDALLLWRKDGRTFAAKGFKQRAEWPGRTVVDVSDSVPVDASVLDNLLKCRDSFERLADVRVDAADDYVYWIYARHGTSEGKYLTRDAVLRSERDASGFPTTADKFWVDMSPFFKPSEQSFPRTENSAR